MAQADLLNTSGGQYSKGKQNYNHPTAIIYSEMLNSNNSNNQLSTPHNFSYCNDFTWSDGFALLTQRQLGLKQKSLMDHCVWSAFDHHILANPGTILRKAKDILTGSPPFLFQSVQF